MCTNKIIKNLIKEKADISKLKIQENYNNTCVASITILKVKELTK
nr:hypothetical protein [[Eubacterium] tenue]